MPYHAIPVLHFPDLLSDSGRAAFRARNRATSPAWDTNATCASTKTLWKRFVEHTRHMTHDTQRGPEMHA